MTGWLMLLILAIAAAGALWLLKVRGPLLTLCAAALLFGCAGYALQGRPLLGGSPREAVESQPPIPLADIRHAFFGDFGANEHWLLMSESFANRGKTEEAAQILTTAVRLHPRDSELWVGLGNALVDHAGVLTPASQYAFEHAAELAPGHPAPLFFMGLSLARSGDRADAMAMWKGLLSSAPADASWRPMVEQAVLALQEPPPSH